MTGILKRVRVNMLPQTKNIRMPSEAGRGKEG